MPLIVGYRLVKHALHAKGITFTCLHLVVAVCINILYAFSSLLYFEFCTYDK